MSRPLRSQYPDAFYHVTSRGNEQKDIFKNQKDRGKFLAYLESAVTHYGAVIPTYCLMSKTILGRPKFISEISDRNLGQTPDARNVPAVQELAVHPSIDEIIARD